MSSVTNIIMFGRDWERPVIWRKRRLIGRQKPQISMSNEYIDTNRFSISCIGVETTGYLKCIYTTGKGCQEQKPMDGPRHHSKQMETDKADVQSIQNSHEQIMAPKVNTATSLLSIIAAHPVICHPLAAVSDRREVFCERFRNVLMSTHLQMVHQSKGEIMIHEPDVNYNDVNT